MKQTTLSRIWTWIAKSIFYNMLYTTSTCSIRSWMVQFYGILTLVGLFNVKFYLLHWLNIHDLKTHFVITFLNESELIFFFLHTVKWLQVLLYISNNLISVISLHTQFISNFIFKCELICLYTSVVSVSTQLNDFNFCYLTLIILFNIDHLLAHSEVVTSIAI